MAKVKVINNDLNENLNGESFNNSPSETIFNFGPFSITSNFDGREVINYNNVLNSFSKPITLSSLDITDEESTVLLNKNTKVNLNLNRTKLNNFVRYGSAYELIKDSINKIIYSFPGSLFADSQFERGGNITYFDFQYDGVQNTSTFKIPAIIFKNEYNIIFNEGNTSIIENNVLKNLNISYEDYIVWDKNKPLNLDYKIIEYSGDNTSKPYVELTVIGNPFDNLDLTGSTDFHIRPNETKYIDFKLSLDDFDRFILGDDSNTDGFVLNIADLNQTDDGDIITNNIKIVWYKLDGYNFDYKTTKFKSNQQSLLTIGKKYDLYKTDVIYRQLCAPSLKNYDLSENKKVEKLLRLYGAEFDLIKEYVDSILYINRLSYDKKNNIPDEFISSYAKTLGWDYFSLINENEIIDLLFNSETIIKDKNVTTPIELDIELWRRILINTNYFWKSKGTTDAIKSIFMLIGIPNEFININEYVYTVSGKINPNTVPLTIDDFPTNSLPYDNDGYPKAPTENKDFYFQINDSVDSGEGYMNVFRMAGFDLSLTVDNKKSWVESGATYRTYPNTPTYYQGDSRLVLNTKLIDISLDSNRGVEYDFYKYIKEIDYPANSGDFVFNNLFVNISLEVTGDNQTTFIIPSEYVEFEGDIEVRVNGVLLNSSKLYDGISFSTELVEADYTITGNTITLLSGAASSTNGDVVKVTFISGDSLTPDIDLEYVVTRIDTSLHGATFQLPDLPNGDIQLTINGIALIKNTDLFQGDYVVSETGLVSITNQSVVNYFINVPCVQIVYLKINDKDIISRSESARIDGTSGSKVYFSSTLGRFVFKLNYMVNNISEVKILVNGLMIKPNADYTLNPNNKLEVILPGGIKIGDIISAFYLTAGGSYLTPIINEIFGVGDISKMSFLEFIEIIMAKLINVRNRKIISNFNGGWYPTLLKIYIDYLNRSKLSNDNPMKSNGYNFEILFDFLKNYGGFFGKFIDKLLPSTIILRKGGILVRNSIFTKQKFMYRRGVSLNENLEYHGEDGSTFLKEVTTQISLNWSDDYVEI